MKFLPVLLLFMLISGPRFKVLDLNLFFTFILSLSGLLYLSFSKKFSSEILVLNLFLVLFLVTSCISSVLSGAAYFASVEHFVRAFLTFWAAFFVVRMFERFYRGGEHVEAFCRSYEVSFFVNACFVVLVMFVDPIKVFATTHLSQNTKMAALANESVRSVDMVIGGGSVASVIFSVFFVFSFSRFLNRKNLFSVICMFAAFLATMFTGRSGLVALIFSPIPTLLLFNYMTYGKFKIVSVMKFLIGVSCVAVVSLIILFLLASIIFPEEMDLLVEKSLGWSFEPFINYYYTGSFASSSTSELLRMYDGGASFSDVFTLFGSSRTGRDDFYLSSDIGYIRALFTSGFLGLLLIFGKYVFMLLLLLMSLRHNRISKCQIPIVIAMMYYLALVFLANFKEYHQTIRVGFPMLMMFFVLLYGSRFPRRVATDR